MRTLLKNGTVVNVFTGESEKANVLIENEKIIGVGAYTDVDADAVHDVAGKYICPGFIDGHIHIESTMLSPAEFARAAVPHGTTTVIADPHEIANVCGEAGIQYMLESSEGLPMNMYVVLPSCVPATPFCESGARLEAEDLEKFYAHPGVVGLGEVMNYVGVMNGDEKLCRKIKDAQRLGKVVNGHAPLVSEKDLDAYVAAGIGDDHECSSAEEAKERIRKGQRVMIRQGTAARNLEALLPLFEEPWAQRCLLVTDDKHPADLLSKGHIDDIIRMAVWSGKSAVTGIRMATLWAAEYFGLRYVGAVAPGYAADILVLEDLESISVAEVYHRGKIVARNGAVVTDIQKKECRTDRDGFTKSAVGADLEEIVRNSFHMPDLTAEDFMITGGGCRECRAISLIPKELLTDEKHVTVDFEKNNGIDLERDILKIAVVERHHSTGHKGVGFITGAGLKSGAIASSVSHDSHNLIIVGTNEADMAIAGNRIKELQGGIVAVKDGRVIEEMPLPIAGLMSDLPAAEVAELNEAVRAGAHALGVPVGQEIFMTMAFMSLPVIPHLKMTTRGLIDVNRQKLVDLFV